ncbi:HAD-like domain-containing protein [Glomus cerebriforme]|uniref:HAD-like domain-containing protein n=1 Tax=Glomus cerebriforme TaxID=658196 RepID=A0A397TAW7_9GLOM|nr:HAD-like domain-containing protein [Glomus cerebriforme]
MTILGVDVGEWEFSAKATATKTIGDQCRLARINQSILNGLLEYNLNDNQVKDIQVPFLQFAGTYGQLLIEDLMEDLVSLPKMQHRNRKQRIVSVTIKSKEIAKFGIKLDESLIDKKFRESFKSVYKLYPNYGYNSGLSSKEWWSKVIEKTFIEAGINKQNLSQILPRLSTNLYNKFTTSETYELYDETEYVLSELHNTKKIKLGIISNLDERVESIFSSLNIHQYFNFILLSSKFGVEKPDVKIFEKALELGGMNTISKEERSKQILHVGDDEVRDYQGAKNVGINTLLIKRIEDKKSGYATKTTIQNTEQNQQEKLYNIIHNLNELLKYIG